MKPILSVTLIALAAILSILAWHGLFANVTVTEKPIASVSFIYEKHVGNYRQSGRIMDEIYQKLESDGLSTTQGFGIYYDNPKKVDVQHLRSLAGCILPEEMKGKAEKLKGKYLVGTLPEATAPVVRFPYKGKLSVVLGMLKVYPRINAWFKANPEHRGPVMEIYDAPNGEILYIITRPIGEEVVANLWHAQRP